MSDPLRKICESILGLPRNFLSTRGDWSLQFDPAWPKVPVIGGQYNFLIAILLIAAFIWLVRRKFTTTVGQALRWTAMPLCAILFYCLLSGALAFNFVLAAIALVLVVYVYMHDGRSHALRIGLGIVRTCLFALVLFLLNRPMVTVGQGQTEPSVLAVLIDDSGSMRVPDAGSETKPVARLSAVQNLLTGDNGAVMKDLALKHNLRFYKFDRDASPIADVQPPPLPEDAKPVAGRGG